MALTLDFKDGIDLPFWRQVAPRTTTGGATAWGSGEVTSWDNRSRKYAHPKIFLFSLGSSLMSYSPITDGWTNEINPGMSGTFGTGADCVFVPSQGFNGCRVGTGSTTTKIVLDAASPLQNSASVNENQFADRGDGLGFLVRIINKTTGRIEERRIIGNTNGTAPTLYLDQALSSAPNAGDPIEFLAGRVYMLTTGVATSGMFKYYDVLTGVTNTTALSVTNLPTISSTNNTLLPLDESHVPYNRYPGEGFVVGTSTYDIGTTTPTDYTKKCLLATATTVSSITGQATSGDASVLANEYRNFQIRIVEDTITPAAVGQRRKITSHSAGPSAVYNLFSSWTTTPSANCKFVIENDNDKMLLFVSSNTTTYNYNHGTNAWDTSTWATRTTAQQIGFNYQAYGLDVANDTTGKLVRNSHIISPRGNASFIFDILDIAGNSTGSWSSKTIPNAIPSFLSTSAPNNSWVYVPNANQGRYVYIMIPASVAGTGSTYVQRFDLFTKNLQPYTSIPTTYGGYTATGSTTSYGSSPNKAGLYLHVDSSGSVLAAIYFARLNSSTNDWYQLLITK